MRTRHSVGPAGRYPYISDEECPVAFSRDPHRGVLGEATIVEDGRKLLMHKREGADADHRGLLTWDYQRI